MVAFPRNAAAPLLGDRKMYGLISKIVAQSSRRDELVKILLAGVGSSLPGCLNYVVATDPSDPNSIWVTEVWQSKEANGASFSIPSVSAAMIKGRPLIASFLRIAETIPVGGLDALHN